MIFIALAVFLLLNIINIYRNYNIHNGVDDCVVTGQLYLREQLDGELTEDKQALIYQQSEKLSGLFYNEKYANQTAPEKEFVTGACLFFALMLVKTFFTDTAGEIINLFNPISLLVSFNYFCDFTAVNLFGTPVFSYVIVGSVGVIIVFILCVLIFSMPFKMQLRFPKITFRRSVRL